MSPRELLIDRRDKTMRRKPLKFTSKTRQALFWKTFDRIFGGAN